MAVSPLGSALVATSVLVTYSGKPLARRHSWVLNDFSFQEGPFSWGYEFNDGSVGPFEIGRSWEETIGSARQCKWFWAYPLSQNAPSVLLSDVPKQSLAGYFPRDGSALLVIEGSQVQYLLHFKDASLRKIDVGRYIFAGL